MSWIKVRTNLPDDPRVAFMSRQTGYPVPHVVGALVALWSYADQFSTDGTLPFVVDSTVDAMLGEARDGRATFTQALAAVGWLGWDDERHRIYLPRFPEHNGETAKARANGAKRQQRYRTAEPRNGDGVTGCVVSRDGDGVTRLDKRRVEEKRKESARARKGGL